MARRVISHELLTPGLTCGHGPRGNCAAVSFLHQLGAEGKGVRGRQTISRLNRRLVKHPRSLDAGASLGGVILVESDISASSGEFYTLHVAVTWLADKDPKNIRESRLIEDGAQLSHESCVRG